ncbi:MAG: FKBP-type peptidyl-prolyl cis-trans isomerase [Novosphingobium sp.]
MIARFAPSRRLFVLAGIGTAILAAPLVAKPAKAPARGSDRAPAAPRQIIPLPLKQIIPAAQRQCSAKTASGLGYRVLRGASGPKPVGDATVTVNYIGYLAATGEVFDQGMESAFPMQRVIPGFSEGLALMPAGSIYRLCIPARLGYGDKSTGPIPPNADLVFQVELIPNLTTPARAN